MATTAAKEGKEKAPAAKGKGSSKKPAAKGKSNNNSGLTPIDADANGQAYMPGMEPVVIKELVDCVKDIETNLKPAFAAARDALVVAQDQLSDIAHKNIQHFVKDEVTGKSVYHAAGVKVEIFFEKEKIKTALEPVKQPDVDE